MTAARLRRIVAAVRFVKAIIEVPILGLVAYAISAGGPNDTRPIALAVLVLASIAYDVRDHLRPWGDP